MRALAGCTFQFAYTTLFGWFAAYLLVKTGESELCRGRCASEEATSGY